MPEIDELLQAGDPLGGVDARGWDEEALQVAREAPVAAGRSRGRWVPLVAAAAAVTLVAGGLTWQHRAQRGVPAAPVRSGPSAPGVSQTPGAPGPSQSPWGPVLQGRHAARTGFQRNNGLGASEVLDPCGTGYASAVQSLAPRDLSLPPALSTRQVAASIVTMAPCYRPDPWAPVRVATLPQDAVNVQLSYVNVANDCWIHAWLLAARREQAAAKDLAAASATDDKRRVLAAQQRVATAQREQSAARAALARLAQNDLVRRSTAAHGAPAASYNEKVLSLMQAKQVAAVAAQWDGAPDELKSHIR